MGIIKKTLGPNGYVVEETNVDARFEAVKASEAAATPFRGDNVKLVDTDGNTWVWNGAAYAIETSAGGGATPDATTVSKGKLQLAGALGGTADSPTALGYANAAALAGDLSGLAAAIAAKASAAALLAHTSDTANPHTVTKTQLGLSNVDDTSDAAKPISTATQTALNAKQPGDATLTALAALNASSGLLEQTAPDTFTKRAIGVAAATDVPTRGDADARYATVLSKLGIVSGTPTGGVDGELRAGIAKPDIGLIWSRTGGVWGILDNAYADWPTLLAQAPAATYPGRVVWVTALGAAYRSDGTNWRPVNPYLRANFPGTVATPVQTINPVPTTGALFTTATVTFQAGSLYVGKAFRLTYKLRRAGATVAQTISHQVKFGAANTYAGDFSISNLSNLSQTDGLETRHVVDIEIANSGANVVAQGTNGLGITTTAANQFANSISAALNLAVAAYLNIGCTISTTAGDSCVLVGMKLEELS